jgi:microcompartment protein CcmK/EutM
MILAQVVGTVVSTRKDIGLSASSSSSCASSTRR